MGKRIEELKNGEAIHYYGIATFPDREFLFYKELTVDNNESTLKFSSRDFATAYETNSPRVRHIIKGNESIIYRNTLWLTKRDDEQAKKLILEYLNRKIQVAQHTIDLYEARIAQTETFFEQELSGKF